MKLCLNLGRIRERPKFHLSYTPVNLEVIINSLERMFPIVKKMVSCLVFPSLFGLSAVETEKLDCYLSKETVLV
jgi:hypothetical protein